MSNPTYHMAVHLRGSAVASTNKSPLPILAAWGAQPFMASPMPQGRVVASGPGGLETRCGFNRWSRPRGGRWGDDVAVDSRRLVASGHDQPAAPPHPHTGIVGDGLDGSLRALRAPGRGVALWGGLASSCNGLLAFLGSTASPAVP